MSFVLLATLTPDSAKAQISFGKSILSGAITGEGTLKRPTVLDFGPDGRLYVGQLNGYIEIYTVARTAPNSYTVTAHEEVDVIRSIPNRQDDGTINPAITSRQITGLLLTGTPATPVMYVSSSDPRRGGGNDGDDTNLDTNSSIISRLTWTGSEWEKLDLVRGLPRSEESHAANGIQIDAATNTLYVPIAGNTNQGAPSNNFAFLAEYALTTAILAIDLNAIGETTYDLPTLDDEDRSGPAGAPAGYEDDFDPFGGNNGKNQAILDPSGPIQIHATGFRNSYDLLITSLGRMYTIDNGSNAGWGGAPVGCTNGVQELGTSDPDSLHYITAAGYHGGFPNPTRGDMSNTFNPTNPQSPVQSSNPVECAYLTPGVANGALETFTHSTNGMAEYIASSFDSEMQGDLLTTSFDNKVWRLKLNPAGDTVVTKQALFSDVGDEPLDIDVHGDADEFPGTIWVANFHGDGTIIVYEPEDASLCTGADDTGLDEDFDCFSNADEIDNGTNPCSAGDAPEDSDLDCVSNLNDDDDDNDGTIDTLDYFPRDADDGLSTIVPLEYSWDTGAPSAGKILNLGFTGLMSNGINDYETLFDEAVMTAGGAAGVMTVDAVPPGDALATINSQEYGFQFAVDVAGAPNQFTAYTRVLGPFLGLTPEDHQSMGLFIGTGSQDDYAKVVVASNGGSGGISFGKEIAGTFTSGATDGVTLPGPDAVELFLRVDKSASTVQAGYQLIQGGTIGDVVLLGTPESIPASWLSGTTRGLAVGLISTSRGAGATMPATWDFVKVLVPNCGIDDDCDDGNPCRTDECNAMVGCVGAAVENGIACDDGQFCTANDSCQAGLCTGVGDPCAAGPVCTSTCNEAANNCLAPGGTACNNDGDLCSLDECDGFGGCQFVSDVVCDAAEPCDGGATCNTVTGICEDNPDPPAGTSCDDGASCTSPDACDGLGSCLGVNTCPNQELCDIVTDQCEVATGDPDNDGLFDSDDPCPLQARNLCYGPVAVDRATGKNIRLNANAVTGSCQGDRVDCNGDLWVEDFAYNQEGNHAVCTLPSGCPIAGVSDIFGCEDAATEDLFQCAHWDPRSLPLLSYTFDVIDGDYLVNLYFAATYNSAQDGPETVGTRIFDIIVEGTTVYDDFDHVAEASPMVAGTAVVRSALATVSDGDGLQITFFNEVDSPSIKAIEVLVGPRLCTTAADCNDQNPCTLDSCVSGLCESDSAPQEGLSCDDGLFCTAADTCEAGFCVGTGNPCFGGNQCSNTCNEVAGNCLAPVGSACDLDADPCTIDQCDGAGTCSFASNDDCSDGNVCTSDSCTAGVGCQSVPVADGTACDDGLFCTQTDSCQSGVCTGSGDPCSSGVQCSNVCVEEDDSCTAPAGSPCDLDADLCTLDLCDGSGNCDFIQDVTCTAPDQCEGGAACNPLTGNCDPFADPASGTACDDGADCTSDDACDGQGSCVGSDTCPVGTMCNIAENSCGAPTGDIDNDGLAGNDDPCPFDPRNLCFGPVASDGTTGLEIRVNANTASHSCSGTRVDCNGSTWHADFGWNEQGNSAECSLPNGCNISGINAIFGCDDDPTEDIFQCEHWDPSSQPELAYDFDVPNGTYLVNLLFASTFNTSSGPEQVGERVFDITIENTVVYDDFDQVEVAGGTGIAVIRSAVIEVVDGNGLHIVFGHETENPAIKGIEVLSEMTACASAADCNDNNACTEDACISSECVNDPVPHNGEVCDDGIFCNGPDTCSGGSCSAHSGDPCSGNTECANQCFEAAESCNSPSGTPCSADGNPCTDDVCTGAGQCGLANNAACDDGIFCNGTDVCASGSCSIHNGSPCTTGETCNESNDTCEAPPCVDLTLPTSVQCHVGQACDVTVSMESDGLDVAAISGRLSSGVAFECDASCMPQAGATNATCVTNPDTCVSILEDALPEVTPFADGTIAALRLTCTDQGTDELCFDGQTAEDTTGSPVEVCGDDCVSFICNGCLPGDCNQNGVVDMGDAVCTALCLIGLENNGADCACAADCNCIDGTEAGDPVCTVLRAIGMFDPDTCVAGHGGNLTLGNNTAAISLKQRGPMLTQNKQARRATILLTGPDSDRVGGVMGGLFVDASRVKRVKLARRLRKHGYALKKSISSLGHVGYAIVAPLSADEVQPIGKGRMLRIRMTLDAASIEIGQHRFGSIGGLPLTTGGGG